MKRWMVYLACLTALLLLPQGQGTDVGRLQPAEILYIYIEDGAVVAQTDTGNRGAAYSLEAAFANMKGTADGEVFLDTVAYLLVTEETKAMLPEIGEYLRPGTEVVLAAGNVELGKLAGFLKIHKPEVRLCTCMVGQPDLPKLMTAGEQWYLVQQSN